MSLWSSIALADQMRNYKHSIDQSLPGFLTAYDFNECTGPKSAPSVANGNSDPFARLQRFYQFEEGTGTTTAESRCSTVSVAATLDDSAMWTTRTNGGNAITLGATDAKQLDVGDLSYLVEDEGSMMFWIKTNQVPTGTWPWAWPGLYVTERAGVKGDLVWGQLNPSGKIGMLVHNTNYPSTATVNDNNWHHVAIHHSAFTGEIKIWVDFTLDSTHAGPVYSRFMNIGMSCSAATCSNANIDLPAKTQMQNWGHTVTGHSASTFTYTPYDAVVVSETVSSSSTLWQKLIDVGVLNFEGACDNEYRIGTGGSSNLGGSTTCNVLDSNHFITKGYSGVVTVSTSTGSLGYVRPVIADVKILLQYTSSANDDRLVYIDGGGTLDDASITPARRVFYPAQFTNKFTADGTVFFNRSLEYAASRVDHGLTKLGERPSSKAQFLSASVDDFMVFDTLMTQTIVDAYKLFKTATCPAGDAALVQSPAWTSTDDNSNLVDTDFVRWSAVHTTLPATPSISGLFARYNIPLVNDFLDTQVSATVAGFYSATVLSDRTGTPAIGTNPYSFNIIPGPMVPGKTVLTGQSTVIAGVSGSFVANLYDQYNNNVTAHPLTVTLNQGGTNVVASVAKQTASYLVTYNLTLAGPFSTLLNGHTGSQKTITVQPTIADPRLTTISTSPPANSVAGTGFAFNIRERDVFANDRSQSMLTWTASWASPSAPSVVASVSTTNNGFHTVTTNLTLVATYSISLTSSSQSPYASVSSVTVIPNAAYHGTSRIDPIQSTAVAGSGFTTVVQLKDAFGNNRTTNDENGLLTYQATSPGKSPISENTKFGGPVDGSYRAIFVPTLTGPYTVNAMLYGQPIGDSPRQITILPATTNAGKSFVWGSGMATTTAGLGSIVYIQARDVYENNRTVGTGDNWIVTVTPTPATGPTVVTHDNAAGQYRVSWNATVATQYTLTVKLSSSNVGNTPATATVLPNVATVRSQIPSPFVATRAGWKQPLLVVALDAFGNNVSTTNDNFDVSVRNPSAGNAIVWQPQAEDKSVDGAARYFFSVNMTQTGSFQTWVHLAGQHIAGSPFSFTGFPDVISPKHSVIEGNARFGGVAGQPRSLQMSPKDRFNNSLSSCTTQYDNSLAYNADGYFPTTEWTVGMWVYRHITGTNTDQVLISVMRGSSNDFMNLRNIADLRNLLKIDGTQVQKLTGLSVPVQQWVYVTSRRQGDKYWTSVGNTEVQSTGFPSGPFDAPSPGVATTITFGQEQDSPLGSFQTTQYLQARLDEYSVWSRKMTLAEVQTLSTQPLLGTEADLVSWYDFNECSGQFITDKGPYGVHLTVSYNVVWVKEMSPAGKPIATNFNTGTGGQLAAASFTGVSDPQAFYHTDGINVTVSGSYTVSPKHPTSNELFGSAPYQTVIVPAGPHVPLTVVEGPALRGACVAGLRCDLTLQLRDQYFNNRTDTTQPVNFAVTYPNSVSAVVSPIPNQGMYMASVAYNISGPIAISITGGGMTVLGSPFQTVVHAAPVAAAQSMAHAFTNTVNGGSLLVLAKDVFNNTQSVQAVTFQVTVQHQIYAGVTIAATTTAIGNGYHRATYNATVSGMYTISTKYGGQDVINSPQVIDMLPAGTHGPTSIVNEVTGTRIAGDELTINVQSRDQFGNNRTVTSDIVTVNIQGTSPNGVNVQIAATVQAASPSSSGKYVAAVTPTIAATYSINTVLNGWNAPVPATQTIHAAPVSTPTSVIFGPGFTGGTAGVPVNVTVQLRDQYQNNRTSGSHTMHYRVLAQNDNSVAANGTSTLQNSALQLYGVSYTLTIAKSYTVSMFYESVGGALITGSTYAITIVPAPISASKTTAVATTTLTSFGVLATATFDVVARDAFENIRPTNADTINIASNDNAVLTVDSATMSHVTASTYRGSYTTHTRGVAQISIRVNGNTEHIVGSPFNIEVLGIANITSMTPAFGPVTGGTKLTLYGNNFVDSSTFLQAKVGNTPCTSTQFVSVTQCICTTPAGTLTNYTLSVSNNLQNFSAPSSTEFMYIPLETVTSFTPNNAPIYGRVLVTISGTNFRSSPFLTCKFGNAPITEPVVFVSPSEIVCSAPQNDVGLVDVQVANNGETFAKDPVNQFKYIEPFSPLCRVEGELSVGIPERQKLGIAYYPNLAVNASYTGSTSGRLNGISPEGVVDGDRCCKKTVANEGFKCGVAFPQMLSNATELVQFVIELNREAFVNEFVSSWYLPCRNQPAYYDIDYFDGGSQQWVQVLQRVTKADAISIAPQRSCFFIPSDINDVSLCLDFMTTEIRASKFRVRFNNTEFWMGVLDVTTDGGWIFEFEAHGVFTDIPEFMYVETNGINGSTVVSTPNTVLGALAIASQNHQREFLLGNDTSSTTFSLKLTSNGNDVTSNYLRGTKIKSLTLGRLNFTDLYLFNPLVGQYTLTLSSDAYPTISTIISNFTVGEGPAVSMSVVSATTQTSQSVRNLTLNTYTIRAYDSGGNWVGATDSQRTIGATLVASNASATLSGRVYETMTTGQVIFDELSLLSPVVGTHRIFFTSAGLSNASITITVTNGPADTAIVTTTKTSFKSAASVVLNDFTVSLRDAGNVQTPLADSGFLVEVKLLNGSYSMSGTQVKSASNGAVVFSGLTLTNPTAGTLAFVFGSTNLLVNGSMQIAIEIGAPVRLQIGNAPRTRYQSRVSTVLDTYIVWGMDAGGSFVGATDVATRTVTVNLLNTTTSVFTSHGSTFTMTQGNSTAVGLTFNRPALGTYAFRFSCAGLESVDTSIVVETGPAYEIVRSSAGVVSVNTSVITNIPSVTFVLHDAGGAVVGDLDTQNRTVTVSCNVSSVLRGSGAVGYMVNGTLSLSEIGFDRPPAGSYRLTFTSNGLQSATLDVIVSTGDPSALVLSVVNPGAQYPSAASVKLNDITLAAVDASGTQVQADRVFGRNVTVSSLNVSTSFLSGTTWVAYAGQAQVLFNDLYLNAPPATVVRINFAANGLTPAFVDIHVVVGQPYRLYVASAGKESYPTAALVTLDSITIGTLDIGGTISTSLNGASVNVSGSDGLMLSGTLKQPTTGGTTTFSSIQAVRPTNRNYTLMFTASGLLSVNRSLQVTEGPAYALKFTNANGGTYASNDIVHLDALPLITVDAVGNQVPIGLAAQHNVTVYLTNSTGQSLFGGIRSVNMTTTSVSFGNLSMITPLFGVYELEFRAAGLQSTRTSFTITIGTPRSLRVEGTGSSEIVLDSEPVSMIPTITVRSYDVAGSFVGSVDTANRTVVVEMHPQNGQLLGAWTYTMVNSVVQMDNLRLGNTQRGNYTLVFSTTSGISNTSVQVRVKKGQAISLSSTPEVVSVVSDYASTVPMINVTILDAGGDLTNRSPYHSSCGFPITTKVLSNSSSASFLAGSSVLMTSSSGVLMLSDLIVQNATAGNYRLSIESCGLRNSSVELVVNVGPARSLSVESPNQGFEIKSAVNSVVPSIVVNGRDAGNNFVGTNDGLTRTLSLTQFGGSSLTIEGNVTTMMKNGNGSFEGLSFVRPKIGMYMFRIESAGMILATLKVNVVEGIPDRMVVGASPQVISDALVNVSTISVRFVDAGSNAITNPEHSSYGLNVTVFDPATIGGKLMYVAVNASVAVDGLTMEKPLSRYYTVELRTNAVGVSAVNVTWFVFPGTATQSVISGSIPAPLASDNSVLIPPVIVIAKDAAGNEAFNPDSKFDVVAEIVGLKISGGTSFQMESGATSVNGIRLLNPVQGNYTLNIQVVGLNNISVPIRVINGPPKSLAISGGSSFEFASQVLSNVPSITVQTNDAGGLLTKVGVSNVTASVDGQPNMLVGQRTVSINNGQAVFTGLQMVRPSASVGSYTIRFKSSVSLTETTVNVKIVRGPPELFRVTQRGRTSVPCVEVTSLDTIVIGAFDAGNTFVGDVDNDRAANISVVGTNVTMLSSGTQTTMINGTAKFDTKIVAPKVGRYVMMIQVGELASQMLWVDVTPGPSTRMEMFFPAVGVNVTVTSTLETAVGVVQMRTLDAGGNINGAADGQSRNLLASVLRSTGSATGSKVSLVASGVNSVMTDGAATFSNLKLIRPYVGLHTLEISTSGLASAFVNVVVLPGPVSGLLAPVTANDVPLSATYLGGGTGRVSLPSMTVTTIDVSDNVQSNTSVPRMVTLTVASVGGSASVVGSSIIVSKSVSNPIAAGTTTQSTGTNGKAVFADIELVAKSGEYVLTFSSAGLTTTTKRMMIQPGPAYTAEIVRNASLVYQNDRTALPVQPLLKLVDDQGNFINATGTNGLVLSIAPAVQQLQGEFSIFTNGLTSFTSISFLGVYGRSYQFTFSLQDNVGSPVNPSRVVVIPNAVTAVQCEEIRAGSQADANTGTNCVCKPGYAAQESSQPCKACRSGEYQPESNQVECLSCPAFMDTQGFQASQSSDLCQCIDGYFELAEKDSKGSRACARCTTGGVCKQGQSIRAQPGFFSFKEGSSTFYQCFNPKACQGGLNNTCAKGYTGPLCSVCEDGYGSFGSTCTVCGEPEGSVSERGRREGE
eukprot:TRINITY_DN231_c0_g1_i21.p1 TRINITY_DN231_c0_g1~~TRINITY_DN231_c0_g1_i21.p1  ORF type:complete len:4505 (+),score=1241.59 TRINITY_DN231_c0_g1_i21:2738-16252(+)